MSVLIKLNKNEQSPCCAICVYMQKQNGDMYCTKKKKTVVPNKKCFRFEVDIMALGSKRKHTVSQEIDPADYTI